MMGKKNGHVRARWGTRLLCLTLMCLLLLPLAAMPVQAGFGFKKETTRAIGIVFDNSGSMYVKPNTNAWCRATYAMEVFASMMNKGDTLQIYPMWDITVNGSTYTHQSPLTIKGGDDTSLIRNIYTPEPSGTPIDTITSAYNGLKQVKSDEKWLIVLTDGDKFYETREDTDPGMTVEQTEQKLAEVLTEYNKDVNVMYLGVGSVAVVPTVADNGSMVSHVVKAADSGAVLEQLTNMCNMIFGRDIVAASQNRVSFDVSMRKLILFVQGADIRDVTLKDASGKSVGQPSQVYNPCYGELGSGKYKIDVDKNLSGYIAVYDTDIEAGQYTLEYSGNVSSVSVYYEPDVDLGVTLTDADGNLLDVNGDLYPGTYYMNYGLIDKAGLPTSSDLLGSTNYAVTYRINGEEKVVRSDKSGRIELKDLKADDKLEAIKFNVTYLSGYTISKTSADLQWPQFWPIIPRPAKLLEAKLSGVQDQYSLSGVEGNTFHLQLIYDGIPLTEAQLSSVELAVKMEGGNLACDILPAGDGFDITLKHAGAAAQTTCGPYSMPIEAVYTNEYQVRSNPARATAAFAVTDDGYNLAVAVEGENYFVISKLDSSEPILVKVMQVRGEETQPLSDEQLAATVLTASGGDLSFDVQPVAGESAFQVRIREDDNAKKGKYDLHFEAASRDQVGRPITAEGELAVKLSPYPRWLPWLIAALILATLLTLFWLFMNMKVLPKSIRTNINQTSFTVRGRPIAGTSNPAFHGGGKRSGDLSLSLPAYPNDPLVNGSFRLELEAVSPRRVKSSRRRAKVKLIAPGNMAAFGSLTIGTRVLTRGMGANGTPAWFLNGKELQGNSPVVSFEIGGNVHCVYTGRTTMNVSFAYDTYLQFR